ncbi:MAG: zinc-binding dehydrogenase [Methanomassiliicoccales archaeon]
MKAWRFDTFGNYEKLKLEEIREMVVGEHEVKIRVGVAGVNPVDRSTLSGRFDWIRRPFVTGAEFTGTVVDAGGKVNGISKGERVAVFPRLFCGRCHYCLRGDETACLINTHMDRAPFIIGVEREGGWEEFVNVPDTNVIPLPDHISMLDAATVPVDGGTAMRMVGRAHPSPGEFMLVMGSTGGIGSFAVQLGRMYGCEVAAVVSRDEHGNKLSELGADHIINREREEVVKRVKELTNSRGADIVIDPLGSATFQSSTLALAPLGRYATCGILTGAKAEVDLARLYSMQIEYIGSTNMRRVDVINMLSFIASGKIKPLIDSVFNFNDLPKAMQRLDTKGRFGKVMMRVDASAK